MILACLLYARSHLLLAKLPPAAAVVTEATAAKEATTTTTIQQNNPPPTPPPPPPPVTSFFDLPPVPALLPAPKNNPEAATIDLTALRGRVVLAFNSASKCGFTKSNLKGLSSLAQKHGPEGLTVLGFPCNAFGGQEPGGPFEIAAEFAKVRGPELASPYFLLASKVGAVAGEEAHQVFKFLASSSKTSSSESTIPTWNFFKYVIGRDGKVAASFGSEYREAELEAAVVEALKKKSM